MRVLSTILLLATSVSAQGIPREEFRERRAAVQKSLDGVLVLFGAVESEDLHTGFFQDTNFLYLTGWRESGAALILTKQEEILFLPPRNLAAEKFTGRKLTADDAEALRQTGFARVLPKSALQ